MLTIPEPRKHNIHDYGAYASRARALRKKQGLELEPTSLNHSDSKTDEPELMSPEGSHFQRSCRPQKALG